MSILETKKLVKERGWGGPGKAVISFTSTVNGYHHFKKRPFQGSQFLMQCRPEMGNKYDKAATLVVAPKLDVVAPELHDKETRAASTSGRDRQQTVREICGHPVGRVPKGLSAVVRFAINNGWGAYCWYLGTMTHDGPVRGGGPKLNECYVMVGERRMADEIVRQIKRNGGRDINVL
eukprot:XP_011682055.1 PREDICTED: uncharacterized protein LOC105446672 [Strongylocentrotus purpuratus]